MKAQRFSLDIISTLPQAIIESILCLLPIEEAARTSILSREWRFKWTKIPKLVFHDSTVKGSRWELFYAMLQVLLQRQGPIHDFTLSMIVASETCFEIDQIMLHLSRNHTIKKLTIRLHDYSLPLSLFSLHQLTALYLDSCEISHKPIFNGFGSLTILSLTDLVISTESFLHLLSNCPSLKSLYLLMDGHCYLGNSEIPILEFFKCVLVIEHLTISRCFSEYIIQASVPKKLILTSQMRLKHFCFKEMMVSETKGWTFLSTLIKCSPKLEKIKLEMCSYHDDYGEGFVFEEYSDIWLEHLNELEIIDFTNTKIELEFLKFVLARSPNLKKMILLIWMDDKDEELKMLKSLLSAPRASPVEIIVKNHC